MPIFKPNQKTYAMDPMDAPLASVAQGEAFTLFTENALDAEEGYFNPLTGPISVEGAKAGDTLAVDILEIRMTARRSAASIMVWARCHPQRIPRFWARRLWNASIIMCSRVKTLFARKTNACALPTSLF